MDRLATIERLATLIEQTCKSGGMVFDDFPVHQICGISVNIMYFIKRLPSGVSSELSISTNEIKDEPDGNWKLYNYELENLEKEGLEEVYENFPHFPHFPHKNYVKDVKKILTILPMLHISKQKCMFIIGKESIDEEIVDLFKFENTTTSYEKCCVCLELCGSKIDVCNHVLCISCFLSMPKKVHECDGDCNHLFNCGLKTCPLCRVDFEFLKRIVREEE